MYAEHWNAYYHNQRRGAGPQKALWDVGAERAAALDRLFFAPYFNDALPLIDLGCGTGTQTEYLSRHYQPTVGVDVSSVAIRTANETYQQDNLQFDLLDVTRPEQAHALAKRLGPANVYMRGVVHQILPEDLSAFQTLLLGLMGDGGRCFFNEVSADVRTYFAESSEEFSALPERMQRVFLSNLPPRGLAIQNIDNFFPPERFSLIRLETANLKTNLRFASGDAMAIPSVRGILAASNRNETT